MQDIDYYLEIMNLIQEQMGVKSTRLNSSSTLQRDVGMDGDDADEFMRRFARRFSVNMEGFQFEKYFGPERGFLLFDYLFLRLFKKNALKYVEITIAHLVAVAERKSWFDPDGSSLPRC